MPVDEDQFNDLIGQFITDLGATVHAGNVVIGDRLGLYRALSEIGPADAAALAHHTGTSERYLREWLAGQAAGGYVSTDADARMFWLTEAQHLAQAGEAAVRRIATAAGFTRIRRATETPFNIIYEVRP